MTFFRLSEYGVADITQENAQPAMHGLGRTNEMLESVVYNATTCYNYPSQSQEVDLQTSQSLPRTHNISSNGAPSVVDNAGPSYLKKRPRSSVIVHDQCENYEEEEEEDEEAEEEEEEECQNERKKVRSRLSRPRRAAVVHNQSERRRRERINQKMKALQKLVPNANKKNKASILDEVIDYLKTLQTQVQLMNNMSIPPPQMMIPVPLQLPHHLQMPMLAQMGMGLGFQMGMSPPLQHPFEVPQTMASPWSHTIHNHSSTKSAYPLSDPHSVFLAQHMNTDMYKNMDVFYEQQIKQGKSMGMSSSNSDYIQE